VGGKMKILFVVDKRGRIQHRRAEMFLSRIKDHDIYIGVVSDGIDQWSYDIVYYSHFALFDKVRLRGNIGTYASITSHKCCSDMKNTVESLQVFDRVSVNNSILLEKFRDYIADLYYTPNGVDTKIFKFHRKSMSDYPVFGWVGNIDREIKNYNSILCPLSSIVPRTNFNIIATSKKDREEDLKTQKEMIEFYNSLDFFLVTSGAEGTPNPALEAMSCGVPVISTRVGNMVDIIKDGMNGFLIGTDLGSFIEILNEVKLMSAQKYESMRLNTRDAIEEWDWDIRCENWINFLTST
jgi:glycosyltransferase involved in cell wall biosynthesis